MKRFEYSKTSPLVIHFIFFFLVFLLAAPLFSQDDSPWSQTPILACSEVVVLPSPNVVEIGTLAAVRFSDMVRLAWDTKFESGNHGFEIERRVQDGAAWVTIGFVSPSNQSGGARSYQFTDHSVFEMVTYYRLKQISDNSTAKYSNCMKVIPDPLKATFEIDRSTAGLASGVVMLSITVPSDAAVTVIMFDVYGNRIKTVLRSEDLLAGHHVIPFTTQNLPAGVYLLNMENASGSMNKALLQYAGGI